MPRQSLPSIPQVPKGLPPEQTRFLQALADACRIRFGQTKNEVDRSVTVGELEGTGIIVRNGSNVAAGVVTGDGSIVTTGGNSAAFTDQTTPDAPTGLTVGTPDSTTVLLNWDPPTNTQDYIAYAEVFRSTADDFDVYVTNENTGSTTANNTIFVGTGAYGFADHFEQGSAPVGGYYYFVRWRSYAGNAGTAAESGAVTPALDPANLLAALGEADATDALVFDEIGEFIVKADTFKIRSPDVDGNPIGDLIFAVDTQQNQVVMDAAYIVNLAVTTADIADLAVTNAKINDLDGQKITVGTIEADRIVLDGAVLGTYDNNGTIELTINGIRLNTTNAAGDNILQDENGNALSDTTVLNANTTWAEVLLNGGNNLPTENLVGQGANNPTASSYTQGDFFYNTTDNAFYVLLLIDVEGTPTETWVKWGDITADNIPTDIQDGADNVAGILDGTVAVNSGAIPFAGVNQFVDVVHSATAPSNPTTYVAGTSLATIWIDTGSTPYVTYYWSGSAWVPTGTVGAVTGAGGNLVDENGMPIVDASATNRQQQALGVLGQRIAFETGDLSYVVHEDGTDLYINQSKSISQASSADTGTISVTAGDVITSNRPISLHNESGYPIPSIAHTGYKFITHTNRGTTQRFKIYAPFAAGIIKYASEAAPGGQSIGSHVDWPGNNGTVTWSSTGVPLKTVTTIDISTTDNTAIYHIFYSDTPIIMVKWNTDSEDYAWVPRTEQEVVGARTAAFASFTADPVSAITGATHGAKYYYALSPVGAISNEDGSGGDADHYVPINALGDTYYVHHALAGFQIVALEATTIKAEYWNGSAWTSYATYDHEDATRADLGETFIGSLSAGSGSATPLQSGAAPWRFIGSGRFYLRTNDSNGDEYPVIGYWSELRAWDVNPQAGDIDFADLGGSKPPADATRNFQIDYTYATELARTNADTSSFSGGELAYVTATGLLWLWNGSNWVELDEFRAVLGLNIYEDGGSTPIPTTDVFNSNLDVVWQNGVLQIQYDGTDAGTGQALDLATIDSAAADIVSTVQGIPITIPGGNTQTVTQVGLDIQSSGNEVVNAWSTQFYSVTGSNACSVIWTVGSTTSRYMLGLNADPTFNAGYNSIDYCWFVRGNGTYYAVYENGNPVLSVGTNGQYGTITAGDILIVSWDGTTIRYFHNDTLVREVVPASPASAYYLDSSISGIGSQHTTVIKNISFIVSGSTKPQLNRDIYAEDGATLLADEDLRNSALDVTNDGSNIRISYGSNNSTGVTLDASIVDNVLAYTGGGTFAGALDATNNLTGSGTAFPTDPAPTSGDLFYRTDENKLYEYTGSAWENWATVNTGALADKNAVNLGTSDVTGTLGTANAAAGLINTNVTLNSDGSFDYTGNGTGITIGGLGFSGDLNATKNLTGSGTAFPTDPAPTAGDLFYRTDENKLYQYSGSAWVNWATLNTGALADKNAVDLGTTDVTGTLGTANAASGLINTNVTLNADGTFDYSGSGTGITISGLGFTGALDANKGKTLALVKNFETDLTTSQPGEIALVACDENGEAVASTSGYIIWDGTQVTVPHNPISGNANTVFTYLANQYGFIAFDTQGGTPFTVSSTAVDIAFVWKAANGDWTYDQNNSGGTGTFTPDGDVVALGWVLTGSTTDTIAAAGLFGEPVSLIAAPAAGATFGATWGTDLSSIPTNLSGLAGTEAILNSAVDLQLSGSTISLTGAGSTSAVLAQSAVTDTTNAANISSGTLPDARIQASGVTQYEGNLTIGNIPNALAYTGGGTYTGALNADVTTANDAIFPVLGLAHYWPTNAITSNTFPDVVGGTTATISGTTANATTTTASPSGKAYQQTGNGVGATLLSNATADTLEAGSFTWACWFRSDSTTGNNAARILTRDASDYWAIVIDQTESGDQNVTWYEGNTSRNFDGASQGDWHHIAFVNDGGTMYGYLDGEQKVTGTYTPVSSSRPVVIGCNTESSISTSSSPFVGAITEIRAYSRALSAREIRGLYTIIALQPQDVGYLSTLDEVSLTANVSGTLPAASGGTGITDFSTAAYANANINYATDGSGVLPAANTEATVGATWGTNVGSIPANLSGLTGSEGILNSGIDIALNGSTLSLSGGGTGTAVLANSAVTDTTDAANISSGTIPDARIQASGVTQHEANLTIGNIPNALARTGGGTFIGDLDADVTANNTAAAITSQGALATANTVDLASTGNGGVTGTLAAASGGTGLTSTSTLLNSNVNLSVSGTTFGLSNAGATTFTLDQTNVGLVGVENYATVSTGSNGLNADPFFVDRGKWTSNATINYTTSSTSPAAGTTILQATNPSTGDYEIWSEIIPLDPDKPYKVTLWARQTSGNRKNYPSVRFLNSSQTDIATSGNSTGWSDAGTFWYWGFSNLPFPSNWTRYEFYFGGSHSAVIPSSARYIRVGALIVRSSGVTSPTTSTVEFAQYTLEEAQTDITAIPNALQRTGGGTFTGDLGATAGATWGTDIGNLPTGLGDINATEGTKLGGIQAGATVGATWGTDIGSIPANLSGLTGTEGILNSGIDLQLSGSTISLTGAGSTSAVLANSAVTDTTNASNISSGSLPDGRFTATGVGQYAPLAGMLNKNPYFEWADVDWPPAQATDPNGVTISYITTSTSPSGSSSIYRYQDDANSDNSFFTNRIPINPQQAYTITLWARQPSGNKKNYVTCWFENASGARLDGSTYPTGWPSVGTYHYWGVINQAFPTGWTKYEISIGGDNKPQIPSAAVTVRIGMLALRATDVTSPTASILDLAEYSIREGNPRATADNVTAGGITTIASPRGANYSNNGNTQGAIWVTLPYSATTMIKFEVDIYNYVSNESVTYRIGGHTSGNRWYNVSASNPHGTLYHKVRFGRDNSNTVYVVQIGETTTSWAYPQVRVRNVTLGYANYDAKYWSEGWSVTLESTDVTDDAQGSTNVKSVADTRGNANWQLVGGTGVPADYADVTANNTAAGIASQGAFATLNTVNLATTSNGGVSGILPVANSEADVTADNTAAAITGQGSLATQSSVSKDQVPQESRGNLMDLSNWQGGASSTTPSGFTKYGQSTQSAMHVSDGPKGHRQTMWYCISNGSNSSNGGFSASPEINIDNTKTYRVMVPIQMWNSVTSMTGSMYLGVKPNSVTNVNGTVLQNNPYLVYNNRSDFVNERWYLFVGYIFPYNTTGWTHDGSGHYDMVTGKKLAADYNQNYCWANVTSFNIRSFMAYSSSSDDRALIAAPMIHLVDGSEPPIASFLGDAAYKNTLVTTAETDKAPSATWSALVSSSQVTGPVAPYDVTITWRDGQSTSLGTTVIRMDYTGSGTSFTSVDHTTQSNSAGASVSLNSTDTATRNVSTVTLNGKTVVLDSNVVNGISWSFSK
jgi:hypothetical protein